MALNPNAPLDREGLDEAVQAIWSATEIVLACHVNPDGDAIGSMLGLGLGLEALEKKVTYLSADGFPETLAFLPGIERVQTHTERRDFQLGVGLDAGEVKRLGSNAETILSAPLVMDIDHHVTGGQFGQVQLLDATSASTAELVYDLLLALGVELTPEIAQCLLCGILTDTGSFRFSNTKPRTMAVGGALIAAGASPTTIYESVYENASFGAQKLLGRAMDRMTRSADGKLVWSWVTQADFSELDATDKDTDGIATALRAVRGSEVAVFLREMPTGKLRVSLRAKDPWDVAAVAAQFGGGGHRLASGCSLDGPPEAAIAALLGALTAA
ncbi:DHH family phosphoesterase [Armatimonas rosea]|uniref:Phosphoesterase RecJ-like protein n=1 Tax=Armatimonas rosea TaxID=685828 RepID=A0A7W9W9C5_ARMRO|nr:bifunctional oligoribonuclease/PAP phosphatase NrnA [Armatimonas rosea]MBB6053055.1 phosphoesterase RecJ-like protein [Armatimonas rosea]